MGVRGEGMVVIKGVTPDEVFDFVLDPAQYEDGEAAFLRARVDRMLERYDGLRVDHPHGLICPWVYRSEGADAHSCVQRGGRLFASPDLRDHPRYRITRFRPARLAR